MLLPPELWCTLCVRFRHTHHAVFGVLALKLAGSTEIEVPTADTPITEATDRSLTAITNDSFMHCSLLASWEGIIEPEVWPCSHCYGHLEKLQLLFAEGICNGLHQLFIRRDHNQVSLRIFP